MCNFWTCLITRDGTVVWDPNTSSHEQLIGKANLKDNKLDDRDFVRIEIAPRTRECIASRQREDWKLKVDEEKTLPEWFTAQRKAMNAKCWEAWQTAMSETLWKLQVEKLPALLEEIKAIKYFSMNSEPNPEWHMSWGKDWDAAREAVGDAVGDAARDAAWEAAWEAAWDAAWEAARDAARDAVGDAVGDAAWDASLYARIAILPQDAKIDPKHVEHANARLEVWRKGYGLRCDVNGKLYCYGVRRETE